MYKDILKTMKTTKNKKVKKQCVFDLIGVSLIYIGIGLVTSFFILTLIWSSTAKISNITGNIIELNPYIKVLVSAIASFGLAGITLLIKSIATYE